MVKIALSAGHGKSTSGKRSPDGKVREWNINEAVRKKVEAKLKDYEGVSIITVSDKSGKRDVPLSERTNKANKEKADVYVSIHHNAYGSGWNTAQGVETFVYKTSSKDALRLAQYVQDELVKRTGLKNRGVKTGNLHEVRETNMPAILVEGGFMTNKNEAASMQTSKYQDQMAEAIVNGLDKFFNLKKKEVSNKKSVSKSSSGNLYRVQVGAFGVKGNAEALAKRIKDKTGHNAIVVKEGSLYKVQAGAFSMIENAREVGNDIEKKLKWDVYIKEDN